MNQQAKQNKCNWAPLLANLVISIASGLMGSGLLKLLLSITLVEFLVMAVIIAVFIFVLIIATQRSSIADDELHMYIGKMPKEDEER